MTVRNRLQWPPVVLALLIALQAAALFHELEISRFDLNDSVFHSAMIDACAEQLRSGGDPIDFWAPEWSFGYPVLRTYQPASHLLVAGLHILSGIELDTLFRWTRYLLICLWPLSVFVSARWLGLAPWTAVAAAALAPLVSTEDLFGLEYGSYLWRGSGLFSQSLAAHLFVLTLGAGRRVLESGRRLVPAGVLLGATFLSHFIYGYQAALSLVLLAILAAPLRQRLLRTVVVGSAAAVAVSAFLLPLLLDAPTINRSRWEPSWKWDSLGAAEVFSKLIHGELLDHGRLPTLSLLALLGALAVAATFWPRKGSSARRETAALFALAGASVWLALFCGRPTWGDALRLLGISELTHLHRVIGAVHFFLILLAALGLAQLWTSLAPRGRFGRLAALAVTGALLAPAVAERAAFLEQNRDWGIENIAAHAAEQADLEAILALADEEPGRVFPGLAGSWGSHFRVGWTPVAAWLSKERIPAVSFLFHAMALTADLMFHFDERREDHFRLFNVSAVLAPRGHRVAGFLEPAARSGRFQLWRAPPSGDFEVVTADRAVEVDRESFYAVNQRWLAGAGPTQRHHLRLSFRAGLAGGDPANVDPLPAPTGRSPGNVEWQTRDGEVYRARVRVAPDASAPHLLFKMTHHRNWRATVDGEPRSTVMLSPGFVGVALEPGLHEVKLHYRPEPWRLPLLVVSLLVLLAAGWVEARGRRVVIPSK